MAVLGRKKSATRKQLHIKVGIYPKPFSKIQPIPKSNDFFNSAFSIFPPVSNSKICLQRMCKPFVV